MWLRNQDSQHGFTFIELLVTTTLSLLLMGGAFAAYTSFASRQTKIESARDVQAVLQSARERSRGGDKPDDDCTRLNYYRVWGVQGTQNYYVAVRCDDSGADLQQQTYTLQSGEYLLDDFELFFPPLPGPIPGAPVTISIGEFEDTSVRYEFAVSDQGVISEGQLISD